jgi:hypothetical protein
MRDAAPIGGRKVGNPAAIQKSPLRIAQHRVSIAQGAPVCDPDGRLPASISGG